MSVSVILLVFIFFNRNVYAWSYNPYCWLGKCTKENVNNRQTWNLHLNPYCWLTKCEENYIRKYDLNPSCWFSECKNDANEESKIYNLHCWFTDCNHNHDSNKNNNFWNYMFYWFIDYHNEYSDTENIRYWSFNPYCWFFNCSYQNENIKTTQSWKQTLLEYYNELNKNLFPENENFILWKYSPYCLLGECCNNDAIPGNIKELKETLKEKVYGQHFVELVVDALERHWSPYYKPQKALVFSFNGLIGCGKNYVSKLIAEKLYIKGTKSKYVHQFIGRIHFPLEENSQIYKKNLHLWLKSNITNCPKQLFIFDEVDKMPVTVINAIKPIIDYSNNIDGEDYTRTIFIFISNTGGALIRKHYEDLRNINKQREELRLQDFENLIIQGVFNEEGGLHHSDIIRSSLIDYYIPFLPMEERHVIECIKDEFRQRNVHAPNQIHIREVLQLMEWHHSNNISFSKTGCKGITSKVAAIVTKYYKDSSKNEL